MFARVSKWWRNSRDALREREFTIGRPVFGNRLPETDASRDALARAFPKLRRVTDAASTAWLREAFGDRFNFDVASMVPAQFNAYAEVYNPFVDNTGNGHTSLKWRDAMQHLNITDREQMLAQGFLKQELMPDLSCESGTVSRQLIPQLIERLRANTSTPNECYFAVWHGFGGSAIPREIRETLVLPYRGYHVFAGTIDDARTNFDRQDFTHQSANLWWPAAHAWFLSMDVDFHWSYVGGTRALIDSLLDDDGLEAVEVPRDYTWKRS